MLARVTPLLVMTVVAAALVLRQGSNYHVEAGDSVCPPVTYDSPSPSPTGDQTPEPPHKIANICNPGPNPLSVLDVSAIGGGYNPIVFVFHNPPGCDSPSVSQGPTTATFEITWPTTCVDPGESAGVLVGANCGNACGNVDLTCFDWKDSPQTDSQCFSCSVLTEAGCEYWGGYLDCVSGPNPDDALPLLRFLAGFASNLPAGCPQIGSGSGDSVFGDLSCDGSIDIPDLLRLFRHFAYLSDPLIEGCRSMS
jgi:hypothetical protein